MLDVVTDAIHRLTREAWWSTVHDALDAMSPEDVAAYHAEAGRLEGAAADGLRGG
jgi:hypothetical protein